MKNGPTTTCRASYRHGVKWIAHNDESGNGDGTATIREYISTLLLADLFGADPGRVALDIYYERHRAGLPVGEID